MLSRDVEALTKLICDTPTNHVYCESSNSYHPIIRLIVTIRLIFAIDFTVNEVILQGMRAYVIIIALLHRYGL